MGQKDGFFFQNDLKDCSFTFASMFHHFSFYPICGCVGVLPGGAEKLELPRRRAILTSLNGGLALRFQKNVPGASGWGTF